ncbi:MAG: LemA family protein [Woeseiaceae bacterium]|nr:LemA family protein [Woeseiaceae bacterium]
MDGLPTVLWLPPIAVIAYFIVTFNRLIGLRNACTNARAGIDVNLTRRHDLIPKLVAAVRGYIAHESATLRAVVEARQMAMGQLGAAGSAAAEQQVEQSLSQLVLHVEDYPELKAETLFGNLMRNLTEAEEQISASRRAFNGQVLRLNNLVQGFPSLIVASILGFRTLESYSATNSERVPPTVELGRNTRHDG